MANVTEPLFLRTVVISRRRCKIHTFFFLIQSFFKMQVEGMFLFWGLQNGKSIISFSSSDLPCDRCLRVKLSRRGFAGSRVHGAHACFPIMQSCAFATSSLSIHARGGLFQDRLTSDMPARSPHGYHRTPFHGSLRGLGLVRSLPSLSLRLSA